MDELKLNKCLNQLFKFKADLDKNNIQNSDSEDAELRLINYLIKC
jgi:hypothetical protein